MSKTNFEYLKDICVGNDEALEFIDAAEKEYIESKDLYQKASDSISELEKENDKLQKENDELQKEPEYDNSIDAGIGIINWKSDNLRLQLLMEALGSKIASVGDLKVLRLLEVRPKVSAR